MFYSRDPAQPLSPLCFFFSLCLVFSLSVSAAVPSLPSPAHHHVAVPRIRCCSRTGRSGIHPFHGHSRTTTAATEANGGGGRARTRRADDQHGGAMTWLSARRRGGCMATALACAEMRRARAVPAVPLPPGLCSRTAADDAPISLRLAFRRSIRLAAYVLLLCRCSPLCSDPPESSPPVSGHAERRRSGGAAD